MAGDLLLALAQGEPGQVADLLAAEAEVGVDAGGREPGPQPGEASGPGGAVGLVPGAPPARPTGGAAKSAGTGSRRPHRLTAAAHLV